MVGLVDVTTGGGTLRGEERDGIRVFKGIPFAAPPVGVLRFAPPQPARPWVGVRDATRAAPASLQQDPITGGLIGAEDCLYLNVFAPAEPGPHPVLVWIHGGGGVTGSPSEYDATRFAQHGVVVVTVAYRLGVLGLLYLPELFGGGNFSLLDHLAALRWVRDNCTAFGGDPARVTIAGGSNGGRTVGTLLAVPAAQGLFRQAIVQSGTGVGSLVDEPDRALEVTAELLAELDLDLTTAAKIRELPAERIIDAQHRHSTRSGALVPYRVVVDGKVLPQNPLVAVGQGSAATVALLIGTNHDEHDLFRLLRRFDGTMMLDDNGLAAKTAAYRRLVPDLTAEELRGRVITAADWWIPAIRFAEAHHSVGGAVWMYRLDWRTAPPGAGLGAAHGLDRPLVFDDLDNPYYRLFLGTEPHRAREVATAMHQAWVRFITGWPQWPGYEPSRRTTMVFDTVSGPVADPDREERLIWS
jgi:para-nitrobenzyl esterase